MMLDVFPRMFMWYKMKTSGRLPLSEGSLLGKCLLEERMVKLTHTHAQTDELAPSPASPLRELWQRQPYLSLWQQLSCRLSPRTVSPAGLHITNHITEHTHLLSMHTDAQEGTLHTHEYTYCTYSHTRTYGCMCGCAFHPQFALHRLMARTNCNDVLVQTSCSSQEKHTTLCGCECSCKHVHISLMGSAKDKYVIKGETGKKSANTHIHEKN